MGVSLLIRSDPQTRTTTTKKTMPSFSYETSFTSELSSSSSTESRMSRATSVSSELDELLYQSFNMSDKDKMRLYREFYYPPRISASGNYYPRYKVQGDSQTGTFQVCVCHQDKLRCKVSNRGNKQKELSQEYPKL